MANLILKKMEEDDLKDVQKISELSLEEAWTFDSLSKELNNKLAHYVVCKIDNKVVGFAGSWLIAGEAQVTNVAVHPSYRGKKIGYNLMKSLIETLKNSGCTSITLEVRRSNISAENLYSKVGFKSEGYRTNFYDNPKEDANIMWIRNLV